MSDSAHINQKFTNFKTSIHINTQLNISNAVRSAYMELDLHVRYIWQSEVKI